jgi:4-amino-4-deoxy-L-arabinose transferase-like glycosyltransferase
MAEGTFTEEVKLTRPQLKEVASQSAKKRWRPSWSSLVLEGIVIIAAIVLLFQMDQEGYGNTYYAAAIKSMLTSWHNFFYLSFDNGGFVSVDKPPLGLWIQAASARIFGFSGWSILLPQAVAGLISIVVLYHLVKRAYGPVAGLIAAAVMAVTPIALITERNNTIDSLLICTLLFAVWALLLAVERAQLRWLILSMVLVGLSFNIKMLQAYLVVPAFIIAYLLGAAPLRYRTRIWHLAFSIVILLAVSLSWVIIVDLTPASQRPYIGSSGTNSVISLILGYNGLGRVTAFIAQMGILQFLHLNVDLTTMPGMSPGIGEAGALRLFETSVGIQSSWLLPLALVGLIALPILQRFKFPLGAREHQLLLWGGWLLTAGIYFSTARFFHMYYLIMLAPAIAALAGMIVVASWEASQRGGWYRGIFPIALVLTAGVQAFFLSSASFWNDWLSCLFVGAFLIVVIFLAIELARPAPRKHLLQSLYTVGLVGLLIAPMICSFISVQNGEGGAWLPQATLGSSMSVGGGNIRGGQNGFGGGGNNPGSFGQGGNNSGGFGQNGNNQGSSSQNGNTQGGNNQGGQNMPSGNGGMDGGRGAMGGGSTALTVAGGNWNVLNAGMIQYLQNQQGETRYLVATSTSTYASIFMLATDQPALALGGYQGWDRIVTPEQLAKMVSDNTVRFFYISASQSNGNGANMPGGSNSSSSTSQQSSVNDDLYNWVHSNCSVVDQSNWSSSNTSGNTGSGMQLYDCKK